MIIYRGTTELIDLELDDKSVFKHAIMSDEICVLSFVSELFIDYTIGDHLIYEDQIFTINTPVKRTKIANNEYNYNIRFEGIKYQLAKSLFQLDGKLEFPINSDIEQILDLVIINLNANSDITWLKGTSSITPFFNFEIANENCLQVLNRTCIEFNVEFEVVASASDYTINVRDLIGIFDGVTLEYKKGIFQIETEALGQENMITRLYPFGAKKNIPDSYGSNRIKIDPEENNIDLYGIMEGVKTWEDIFPSFQGSVDTAGGNTFTDTDIDFTINDQLIPGVTAKVVFLSGQLSGYEFEIASATGSSVTLVSLIDDIGQTLPSAIPIGVGDRYTFIDIYMPQSYLNAAEAELLTRAQTYLNKYSVPLTKFSITIDSRYLRDLNIQLYAGQKIILLDFDMIINVELRIYSITQSLADPFQYSIELTDNLQTSRLIELVHGQYDTQKRLEELRKELRTLKHN